MADGSPPIVLLQARTRRAQTHAAPVALVSQLLRDICTQVLVSGAADEIQVLIEHHDLGRLGNAPYHVAGRWYSRRSAHICARQ